MPLGAAAIITLFVWIWALADAIQTDEMLVRNLPKIVWLLLIIFVPLVGSLMWLILGRPSGATMRPGGGAAPIAERRPRRAAPPAQPLPAAPMGPEDSPEYLQKLAEQQRRLREWEDDLKRREDELRRREDGEESGV